MDESTHKHCPICSTTKPLTEFSKNRTKSDGFASQCKSCSAQYAKIYNSKPRPDYKRRWIEANPELARERSKEYRRRWRKANPETAKETARKWRKANPEIVRKTGQRFFETNREIVLEKQRAQRTINRDKVLTYYSPSTPPRCACCYTTKNLSIDHTYGGGSQHRKELFGNLGTSSQFYIWLITEKFPPGYQVLCIRCNSSKGEDTTCHLTH